MLHNSAIQKHHNVISDNLLPMYRHNITSLRSAETRQSLQKLLSNVSNYITDCTASNVQLIVCLFTEQHQRFALFPSCRSCFFILLLKQSDAVNWECRELQNKISGLQTNITRITEQKHKYGQFFGQSKVSIYIYIYQSMQVGTKNSNNNRPEIQDLTSCPTILCRWLLYCSGVVTLIHSCVEQCYVSCYYSVHVSSL